MNQDIAVMDMLVEAKRRMEMQERDQTEYFDDPLIEAIEHVRYGQ